MDKKFSKKSQVAMETLMVYGIAILIVMLAVGALVYFGVLDLGGYLPDKCSFKPNVFYCKDSFADSVAQTVQFRIENNVGKAVNLGMDNVIGDSDCDVNSISSIASDGTQFDVDTSGIVGVDYLTNGDYIDVTLDCAALGPGDKTDISFDLLYTMTGSSYTRRAKGEISIKAE